MKKRKMRKIKRQWGIIKQTVKDMIEDNIKMVVIRDLIEDIKAAASK